MFIYCTADKLGGTTGAGQVCENELIALKTLGECKVFSHPEISNTPFVGDDELVEKIKPLLGKIKLAHFYAGTFSKSIALLKQNNCRISYTCAAHDIELSKQAHADIGLSYNYPHMVNPVLLDNYLKGYRDADLVIVPSTHSRDVVVNQGCKNVKVIFHGCHLPVTVRPIPQRFTVGYLGWVCGADKGVIWLLRAWKKLNYKDALLILAGKDSTSDYAINMVRQYGGGSIYLAGWQKYSSDLYNKCSVYVQPSTTEGFGIEVLEAMSCSRPTICADGVGAADLATKVVSKRNPDVMAQAIDYYKSNPEIIKEHGEKARHIANHNTWVNIKEVYANTWKEMI